MTTKTIYIAFDGHDFENKKDCALYELNKYIKRKSFELLDSQKRSLFKDFYVTQEELEEVYERSEIIFIENIDVLEALREVLPEDTLTPLEDETSELNPYNYGYYKWNCGENTDDFGWEKMG